MNVDPNSGFRGAEGATRVDLYWLPLGAGGRSVRFNGIVFERIASTFQMREPRALFHSALTVQLDGRLLVIEMAPAWPNPSEDRGQALTGPVGLPWAGRIALFRYEIRCWQGGRIPDVEEAVHSPVLLSEDPRSARELVHLVPKVPPLTWGLGQRSLGEMWNSNSVISWLLESSGIGTGDVQAPPGGRAPGWGAGIKLARSE